MHTSILTKYRDPRPPWYTIYPTVPDFSAAVGADDYEEWLGGLPADESVSLYFHIPFCRSMCWYCGFPTAVTRRNDPILNYLAVLRQEISLVSEQARQGLPVSDVHFGGGTPHLIGPAEHLALMEFLRRHFAFSKTAAIAVESIPERSHRKWPKPWQLPVSTARASACRALIPMCKRRSIGSRVRCRRPLPSKISAGMALAISTSISSSVSRNRLQSCIQTAMAAVAMRPNRFAVFGYAHIPSVIKNQRLIEQAGLPDGDVRAEQAAAVAETLVGAGYREIGLDHFALPDDELALAQKTGRLRRNSLGYSADTCKTVIGFGASAVGRVGEGYVQNEVTRDSYARHIASGRLATSKGHRLTDDDRVRAAIIERLMCDLEADVPTICAAHEIEPARFLDSVERLVTLAEEGIVDVENGFIRVRPEHRFVVRAVAAAFDAFLANR